MEKPTTLLEAIRYFSDLDVATEYVAALRWPDGFVCPHCGGRDYSYVSTRRLWKCKSCQKQSSVKVGTILEDSALGLDKWLPAIWLTANRETGVSSHELARALGTTQKSAWFMLHRIGEATIPHAEAPTAPAAPPADIPQPAEECAPDLPEIRDAAETPRWLWPALAFAFALGAAVGRLSNRIRRPRILR
jgi:transposase-like protein